VKEVNKKVAKKPAIKKSSEAVEAVEVEAKTDIKKRKNAKVKVIRIVFHFQSRII